MLTKVERVTMGHQKDKGLVGMTLMQALNLLLPELSITLTGIMLQPDKLLQPFMLLLAETMEKGSCLRGTLRTRLIM
jgi:hypothetical protein